MILLVILIIVVGGFILWSRWIKTSEMPVEESVVTGTDMTLPSGWQTYTDQVHGFSLSYPASSPVDLTSISVGLPEAAGGKERSLQVDILTEGNTEVDSDGCMILQGPSGELLPEKFQIGSIAVCQMVESEGAAGSVYRTYHDTASLQDQGMVDITMTIRSASSPRLYAGCENDEDQSKQLCLDLAFDEARDTALFDEIIQTLREF